MTKKPLNKNLMREFTLLYRAASYSVMCEEYFAVLKEQNVPMPPMLANQLQQQKQLLQQVLTGSAQKGANVQASPIVNDYIQQAVKMGLFQGGDINKIMSGFDQFFIKKNQENVLGQKKQVVAPPQSVTQQTGSRVSLPGEHTFDPKDPFGFKQKQAKEEDMKRRAAIMAAKSKEVVPPGEMSDFDKKMAAKRDLATKMARNKKPAV